MHGLGGGAAVGLGGEGVAAGGHGLAGDVGGQGRVDGGVGLGRGEHRLHLPHHHLEHLRVDPVQPHPAHHVGHLRVELAAGEATEDPLDLRGEVGGLVVVVGVAHVRGSCAG